MLETKYSKFLTVLLIIIIVAVIGLLGYLGYNYYRNYSINSDSDQFVSTFVEEVQNTTNNTTGEVGSISDNINSVAVGSTNNGTTQTFRGFNVIGTIEIPKTGISYPILEAPPTVKKLEVSVAAIYPQNAVLNTEGNVVIVGHNYRNGMFFSDNKKLSNGDKIYITDLNGNRVTYNIYNVFQTSVNDTSFYNRDTDGAMEVTLSTCTDASDDQRVIVEARAE